MAHRFQGIKDENNPCRSEPVKLLLVKVRRAAVKQGWRPSKKKAATLDVFFTLISSCGTEKMIDIRDRALLYFGYRPHPCKNMGLSGFPKDFNALKV